MNFLDETEGKVVKWRLQFRRAYGSRWGHRICPSVAMYGFLEVLAFLDERD